MFKAITSYENLGLSEIPEFEAPFVTFTQFIQELIFPPSFDPRTEKNMKAKDKVEAWIKEVPIDLINGVIYNNCFPVVSLPTDPPDFYEYQDDLDIMEYQSRMVTRLILEKYTAEDAYPPDEYFEQQCLKSALGVYDIY